MLTAYRGANWSSALEHLGEARLIATQALDPPRCSRAEIMFMVALGLLR